MKSRKDADALTHRTAAEWVVRLEAGGDDADQARFLDWVAADKRHEEAFKQAQASWEMIDGLSQSGVIGELLESDWVSERSGDPRFGTTPLIRFRWGWAVGIAASTVLVALFAWAFWASSVQESIGALELETALIETAIGERRHVALSDGSELTINADSKISTVFSEQQRLVVLHGGEAMFEVAEDSRRPFVVSVNGGTVSTVGTSYNIRFRGQSADVTVLDGRVSLSLASPRQVGREPAGSAAPRSIILDAGQAASYDSAEIDVRDLDEQAVDRAVAWQDGRIYFDQATLAEIIDEISHHVPERIVIVDDDVSQFTGGGLFIVDDLDSVLRALELAWPISVTRTAANEVTIGPAAQDGQAPVQRPRVPQ